MRTQLQDLQEEERKVATELITLARNGKHRTLEYQNLALRHEELKNLIHNLQWI
jgi:hypothetical protein